MLGGVVERDSAIMVVSPSRDVADMQRRQAYKAVPDHERYCGPLLLRERQKLLCKLAHHIAIEGHVVRDAKTVEDREQQQRIFRRLAERFGLFDQQTCPLRSRLSFRRGIALDMEKRVYERDLKLDLFAAALVLEAMSRSARVLA
jgi:hypothetical protein